MSLTLTYLDDLSRVRIEASGITADEVRVERSHNELFWQIVRGGRAVEASSGEVSLDDYEFDADVVNHYRVLDASDDTELESGQITPSLDGRPWLKSIRWPFLNRPIFRVVDRGQDIGREPRDIVAPVSGRSTPVVTSDLRRSQTFTLHVQVADDEGAAVMDLVLASGSSFLIHVPPELVGKVPGGYVRIGGTSQHRRNTMERWVFALPCTVEAAPRPDIVGGTMTYGALLNLYGSYANLLAANTAYRDLLELMASPDDLVVI